MHEYFQVRNSRLIRGLQYFEAVARHRSVKGAAEELGVSQSAVSHQMRDLAEELGEQLVARSGRGIVLTNTGERLAEKLGMVFAGLQESLDGVIGRKRTILRLAVCSSFGPGWLIPRLAEFYASHPGIDLQLRLYAHDPELTDHVGDAFVTAAPLKPGFEAVHIFDEFLVPVWSRVLEQKNEKSVRLITTDVEEGKVGRDWVNYCSANARQLSELQTGSWIQCSHYMLASELAKVGLGVALIPDFLAAREVESGNLGYFDRTLLPSNRHYYLCYKKTRANENEMKALARWIKSQRTTQPTIRLVYKSSG